MDTNITIKLLKDNNLTWKKIKEWIIVFKALEKGYKIKKTKNGYILYKKHEGNKKYFTEHFLQRFVEENLDINSLSM